MLDGWTTVFEDPGKRTTGTGAQKFAITGPGWSGTLPPGVKEYKSATGMVWLLGRIYCTGTPEDYKAVHALQDQMTAVPLSSYGKPYTPAPGAVDPGIDMKTAIRDQVNAMDAASYFKLFAQLLKTNPPLAEDAPMVARLAKIGIVPGQDFDASTLDPAVAKGLAGSPKPAQGKIMSWLKEGVAAGDMKFTDGWAFTTKTGLYGTAYRQRALVTAIGLGANRPQDAVYPTSEGPDVLKSYDGAKKYVLHFNKGELPPVDGFWSLTMYDASYFFVPNSDQPLHGEPAQQAQGQRRRFGGPLHPERVARQGQGGELAACAQGQVHSDDAALLAEGKAALDSRRQLEGAAGERGRLILSRAATASI